MEWAGCRAIRSDGRHPSRAACVYTHTCSVERMSSAEGSQVTGIQDKDYNLIWL
jgi:hypothetical protein